ncbi:MAG: N-acetylmuramoyl-L-alanine amidase [Bacilli bacterium]|nr:N-acetylmuramoyl-L-alanine amidase [Bacilli bacterium]MDD4053227.1 N-acetylmuramoyl-L-alanine amidase [Bacilli bacterium]MDD4411249.1 N-acetylmuramoyl-L-alanine amidase [Bacilli bacterium]
MKQYKALIVIFLIISIFLMNKVNGYINELPLLGKVIYIDPGHGGVDPGANYKNILEKDINLEISKTLSTLLIEKGAIVYLTREDDYDLSPPHAYLRKRSDLSRRVKLINESLCDVYLSIHLNATLSTTWRGAQVFYDDVNNQNIILGEKIQESFKKNLGSKRKLKRISDLYMYKDVDRPGVLLEVGFLSNQNERYILRKPYYQKRISNAIVEGLISYFDK